MASPPSLVFQQILQSFKNHPEDEFSDEEEACGRCGEDIDNTPDSHPPHFFFSHSNHQHWTITGKCSKCTDYTHSVTKSAVAMSSSPPDNQHRVHWADDDQRELVRTRPRKKYVRHPPKSSPAKPILKQGRVPHRQS